MRRSANITRSLHSIYPGNAAIAGTIAILFHPDLNGAIRLLLLSCGGTHRVLWYAVEEGAFAAIAHVS